MDGKVMTLKEAIAKYVKEGDTVFFGGMRHAQPYAAIHEIIRRRIGHLTVVPALTMGVNLLAGEGLVDKFKFATIPGLYERGTYSFAKARKNNTFPILEEYSHFGLCLALLAGQMGVPFMPTRTQVGSDMLKYNPDIKVAACPFTGQNIGVVRAINPNVGIIHVQRADAEGSFQKWGTLGMDREGVNASNHIIVTTEKIVDSDVIRRDPNRTMVPGIRVSAVVEEPWGAYPAHLAGYYNLAEADVNPEFSTEEKYERYMKEFIYGVRDRREFIEKVKAAKGQDYFERLRIQQPVWAEPISYGY
ncbi:MAG: CoA transferase subunit A [Chloroflexi bacterium]|nr:CoA transferase subunit A [Chloroflexota bacterium]